MASSDEEGGDDLMPQVFAVEETGQEDDPSIPPSSGMEYLRRVKMEAKKHPKVVKVEIDKKKLNKKQTVGVRNMNSILPAPAGYAPSAVWQNTQASEFSHVRQKLAEYRANVKEQHINPSIELPDKDDVDKWCTLCFGRYRQPESGSAQGVEQQPGSTRSHAAEPVLSLVGHMDQPTVLQVLEYHVNWLNATGFTEHQGRWFYALLSCVEKPILAESCALLRSLARSCANLRASLESCDDPLLPHLNLIICLVSKYFEQKDMADS